MSARDALGPWQRPSMSIRDAFGPRQLPPMSARDALARAPCARMLTSPAGLLGAWCSAASPPRPSARGRPRTPKSTATKQWPHRSSRRTHGLVERPCHARQSTVRTRDQRLLTIKQCTVSDTPRSPPASPRLIERKRRIACRTYTASSSQAVGSRRCDRFPGTMACQWARKRDIALSSPFTLAPGPFEIRRVADPCDATSMPLDSFRSHSPTGRD